MIAHLLLKLPNKVTNYSIYIGFFGILESLFHTDSQTQCIDIILLNWEICDNCDPEDHLRIIRHWNRVLYPSYKSQMNSVWTLSDVLMSIVKQGQYPRFAECQQNLLGMCRRIPTTNTILVVLVTRLCALSKLKIQLIC
jgi:hypothetical protein